MTEAGEHSCCVWVTRPEPAATALVTAIEQAGMRALAVPTLEIVAPADPEQTRADARRCLAQAGLAVFVSRNAVDWLWQLLGNDAADYLSRLEVVAVGPATAAALQARQIEEVITPPANADSESLLGLPSLQASVVAGRQVTIIRGQGGRELLAETLRERGAGVDYIEVYRRQPCTGSAESLPRLWRDQPPAAIVVTSPAGLEALVAMTAAADRPALLATRLLCLGRRLPAQARALGFEDCIPVPATAGNQAIVQTLRAQLVREAHDG